MRIIGLDASIFNVDADDCLAKLTNISLRQNREFVDVSGLNEADGVYRLGGKEIELTGTLHVFDTPQFVDAVTSGSEVYVVFGWNDGSSDHNFSMYAYIGTDTLNFGGRNEAATEEVTLRPSRPGTLSFT